MRGNKRMNRKEFAALVEIDPRQLIDIEKKPVPYSRAAIAWMLRAIWARLASSGLICGG